MSSINSSLGVFYDAEANGTTVATSDISIGSRNTFFRHGRFVVVSLVITVNAQCESKKLLNIPNGFKCRNGEGYLFARCDDGRTGILSVRYDGIYNEMLLKAGEAWRISGVYVLDVTQ